MKKLSGILAIYIISFSGYAWDGVKTGKVASVDVTGGTNYGFRVVLEGAPKLCGNGHGWAYINEPDSNYQTYVSVLLAAKMVGSTVTIYANQEHNSGNGYCHMGYISVR